MHLCRVLVKTLVSAAQQIRQKRWLPITQSFRLSVIVEPIGHFGWLAKQEFYTKVYNDNLTRKVY